MKALSTPIKIAAFVFLVGGILNFLSTLQVLLVLSPLAEKEGLQMFTFQLASYANLVSAALSALIGWFLGQGKRWAYGFGLAWIIFNLIWHVSALLQFGVNRLDLGLGMALFLLALLTAGRKDFAQPKKSV